MARKERNKQAEIPMTEGSIQNRIIAFAVPLLLGNTFQQLYNTADSLIVGRFRGGDALAAVSSSGSLIMLMVGFFNGLALGAGVVIARFYGGNNQRDVHTSIHTAIAFGLLAGIFLTAFGILTTPFILRLMGTPEEVLPNSILYFRIYFCGAIGNVMFNMLQGIHQSVGDSRHPLYYLIISSVVNILLDLLFVAVMGCGVGAAALATILSQLLSATLSLRHLMNGPEEYRVSLKEIRLDRRMLHLIVRNGLPTGVQNSIISIANVTMQSNINAFGAAAMAGCGAYMKIEGFGFLPITCFVMSMTTFVSQNLGAKEYERAKKGARFGITCGVILAELLGLLIYTFAPFLISLFDPDPEVVRFGVMHSRITSPLFCILAFSHCSAGILRGAGKPVVPMVVMALVWCVFRVTYVTIAVQLYPSIRTVASAWPVSWFISSVIFLIYLLKGDWVHGEIS